MVPSFVYLIELSRRISRTLFILSKSPTRISGILSPKSTRNLIGLSDNLLIIPSDISHIRVVTEYGSFIAISDPDSSLARNIVSSTLPITS